MRVKNLAVSCLCVLLLSACSNTWKGVQADTRESGLWSGRGDKNVIEKVTDAVPDAYAGHNPQGVVLKPRQMEAETLPPMMSAPPAPAMPIPPVPLSGDDARWNDIGDLGAYTGGAADDMAPVGSPATPAEGARYNKNVQVFPLEGGFAAPSYSDSSSSTVSSALSEWYGEMAMRIYFDHGSAVIPAGDKAQLHKLAADVGGGPQVSVTVVGHASKRVNSVDDPVQKKVINFEMAQKRASAVTRELKEAGVKPGWVMAVSRGDDVPNPEPGAMPQEVADRRVEIFVDEK